MSDELLIKVRAFADTAWDYFNGYMLDEAEEEECCIDNDQHQLAKKFGEQLRDLFNSFPLAERDHG